MMGVKLGWLYEAGNTSKSWRPASANNHPAANQRCIHNGYLGAMGNPLLAACRRQALMRNIPEAAETVTLSGRLHRLRHHILHWQRMRYS